MTEKLKGAILQAELPYLLKDYLVRNKRIEYFFDQNLLNDIENLYIEQSSLSFFEELEFCSHVISGLQQNNKCDLFHSIHDTIEASLRNRPKQEIPEYEELREGEGSFSEINQDTIQRDFISLLLAFNEFIYLKESKTLNIAYIFIGRLEVLFEMYPTNRYSEDFNTVHKLLEEISEDVRFT